MTALRLIHCLLWLEKEKSVTKSEKKIGNIKSNYKIV